MADIKDRAREYIAEHSEYSEVFGQTFVAVDTMTAMVDFAEQETKELKAQIEKMKCCENCNNYCHRIDHRCNTKCKNLSEWEIKENERCI